MRARSPWWRIDADPPARWAWTPFPAPRHRFDPASGRFRVRYAASDPVAAARERFPSRVITEADGALHLVRLHAGGDGLPALHLTHQTNLDALGLDDRISTGRLDRPGAGGDPLLAVCQRLSDAVFDWWDGSPPPLIYRTRTAKRTRTAPNGRSVAFAQSARWGGRRARPLRDATGLLAVLVLRHGFTVPDHWLV